jgi:PAS domain S-box-containing protein
MPLQADTRLQQIRKLTEVSRALTYAASVEEVLELAVTRTAELLRAENVALLLTDNPGSISVRTTPGLEHLVKSAVSAPLDVSILQLRTLLEEGGRSHFLGVPLIVGGAVSGVLAAAVSQEWGVPTPDEEEWLLSAVADQAAVAVEKLRLNQAAAVAQKERREREEQFRSLYDSPLIGLVFKDLEGRVLDANDAFLSLVGYSREEQETGRLHWDALMPHGTRGTHAGPGGGATSAPWVRPFETELVRKDGGRVQVLMGRARLEEQGRELVFFVDVSAQKRAEEALRRSEERLRLTLEAADMGTWDFDPVTGALSWDGRIKALFGLPSDAEVTYDLWLSRVHPEDRERADRVVQRALDPAGTGEYDVEYRTVSPPGMGERWVHATGRTFFEGGRAVRFIGTVRDISELKAAQKALQRSEREFRTATEAMPNLLWTARPDGQLDYLNPRLANYLGERAGAFLASAWEEVIHPEDLPTFEELWARALATGESFQVERRLRGRDGAYRWFLTRGVALRNEQGQVRRWLGTSTDIDDLKQAEAELRRRSEFEQQLIGIVSHDLRNPLNAILLAAETLMRSGDLTERQAKTVARLLAAAERATRLTHDLLDFTRVRLCGDIPLERKPLDLHVAVRKVLDEVRLAHPERTIELRSSGDGQGVLDGDRLAQVVINLVTNAITYSPAQTPIRVETRGENGALFLSVHNLGSPIPPELLPRLFEPMQRGTSEDSMAGNIGLGLFIVDSIVRAHGGTIEVHSTAKEGTTFRVVLPRDAPERVSSSPAEGLDMVCPGNGQVEGASVRR